MTLRGKLLLAQAPLGLALVLLGVFSVVTVTGLGETAERILADNYRSVLAAQRMKESLERIDRAALFLLAGERARGPDEAAPDMATFEAELQVQENNITEPGEADVTAKLRAAWNGYRTAFGAFAAAPSAAAYFREVEPRFRAAKGAADGILALNQDAMARKSDDARRAAKRKTNLMTGASVAALLAGLFASFALTTRLLRPLDRLSAAVQRVADGDLAARALVSGTDEIAHLAREFDEMAARLEVYRQSTLGELLQAQRASQAAIDSIPDPVIVFDVGGAVLEANRAADTVLRTEGAPPGDSALGRVDPVLRATIERVRDHVLAGRGPYVPRGFEEAVAAHGAEGELWLLPRATPLYGEEGGVTGVTLILQDVTRLRRFDELRNDLVATVAHEFRTPLTSLRLAIHLCVEGAAGELTGKQADLLSAAREDCERLQGIVDDLLDLARLQSGKTQLTLRRVTPAQLLEEAVEAHRADATRRGVQLETQLTPSLDDVEADPGRVALVLANLVANALHHTPADGTVTVSADPLAGAVRFEVRDTGEGIPSEHLPHVFERFFRVPGTKSPGAGLGLSIAKEIVDAHGGAIGADSAPGEGARFWFTLPTVPAQHDEAVAPAESAG
jgi:NtrC-family two-component system sensor histidine kinase KinB